MHYYTGLDVSLKTTSICTLDEKGKVVFQDETSTDPNAILKVISASGYTPEKIAFESGGLSHWLHTKLSQNPIPVVCIDARKMSKVLSININKTDKNDARLIADALRCGFYSEVAKKDSNVVEIGVLLASRRTLKESLIKLKNTIRGHLKTFGIRLGTVSHLKFPVTVREAIKDLGEMVIVSIVALLASYEMIFLEFRKLETKLEKMAKDDPEVQLLCTIPGIGIISAFTFKVHLGDPSRFKKSRSVGAYFGMTPTQYSSGETTRQGKISKCGSIEVRTVLNDASTSLLYCTKAWSKLKAWGLKIRKKKGHKKAAMAVGRKLCVIMHSMLISGKPFEYGNKEELEKAV